MKDQPELTYTLMAIEPGLFTEQTARGSLRRWIDGDHVRFQNGLPQKLGGWSYVNLTGAVPIIGKPRSIESWFTLDGQEMIAFGTGAKLYLTTQDVVYDITPIRRQIGLSNPFTTTSGSSSVLVADSAHGASVGDYVTYSGATAVGGITINGQYQVKTVPTSGTYTITSSSAATSSATGGGSVTAQYDINAGLDDQGFAYGWGSGTWGSGTWGTPRTSSTLVRAIRIWSLDHWGQDLIASPRGGSVYTWQKNLGFTSRAVSISVGDNGSTDGAPTINQHVLVSPESRQLVCLGSSHNYVNDPLYIAVSDNDDYGTFIPTAQNNAYDGRLSSGSKILTGIRTRTGIVLMTDRSVYLMQPTGGADVYSINMISENNSVIGPNAGIEIDGTVYLMGHRKFHKYDGVFQEMECDVWTKVFEDFNFSMTDKIYCWQNDKFSEIWWMYCSASATENDRYVVYNYREKTWTYGSMERSAAIRTINAYNHPIAFDYRGIMYQQEYGYNRYGPAPQDRITEGGDTRITEGDVTRILETMPVETLALSSFVRTYDYSLEGQRSDGGGGNGSEYHAILRAVPDMLEITGTLNLYIYAKAFPGTSYRIKGPYVIDGTTGRLSTRARGKQFGIKLESINLDDYWRAGFVTLESELDGER